MPEECASNALFVKTLIATMCPYATQNIVEEHELDKEQFSKMYSNIDYAKIASLRTLNEMMEFILDFYSDKIMPFESYKKSLCC